MLCIRFIIITSLLCLTSCKKKGCKTIKNQDYSVELTFSSFWDCGVFEKIILDNKTDGDPAIREKIKEYHLYEIHIKAQLL